MPRSAFPADRRGRPFGASAGGSWALRYDIRGKDVDAAGYYFQDEHFEIGEYVSIREANAMHTYRVISVEPV